MCNAHNHRSWCQCGFGGEGHLGRGHSHVGACPDLTRVQWRYHDDDFCIPRRCPHGCGADVFFVRHNGGSVWFDELGKPWPKHKCFGDDLYGLELRQALVAEHHANSVPLFGVVIEARITPSGHSGSVVVKCSNGTLIDQEIITPRALASLVGSLTIVVVATRKVVYP